MKTLKDYLIEGAREDLIPLMAEWDVVWRSQGIYALGLAEVMSQHPELSYEEVLARAGYRWLTMKYPPVSPQVQESSQAVSKILQAYHLPKWAIIAWCLLVLLILGVIAARSEPKPHFAFTVPNGLLFAIDRVGPSILVQDEGTQIAYWAAGVAQFNFTGGGITCTYASGKVTCNVPTGGGGASWDAITNPLANQSIAMGAFTTTHTFGAATGAGINLWNITDTLNNTGTGVLFRVFTASGSAAIPFQADANGNGIRLSTAGLLGPLGTGGINSTQINGVSVTGTPVNGQVPIASSGTAAAWGDPIVSGPTAVGSAPTTNPVYVAGLDGTNIRFFKFFDIDSGAGTDYNLGISLRKAASGGSVEMGTAADPIRTDPTGTTTQPVNVAQINGVAPSMGNGISGTGVQRVTIASDSTGQVNATEGGATGSAVPARAGYSGAVSSGNLAGIIACDSSVVINVSTAVTTQLVALTSGQTIYVCSFSFMSAGTTNVTFEYGTGTLCATGLTTLTGAYNLTAQTGVSQGSGLGTVFRTAAGNALCIVNSAAVQVSGVVSYTKF